MKFCPNIQLIRGLRMLSLVLGSELTDASVAAIASSYPNLELLDLSGYESVPILIDFEVFVEVLKMYLPWRQKKRDGTQYRR